jgi:hypothetical protein
MKIFEQTRKKTIIEESGNRGDTHKKRWVSLYPPYDSRFNISYAGYDSRFNISYARYIEVGQPVTRTAPSHDERNYRIGLFKMTRFHTLSELIMSHQKCTF